MKTHYSISIPKPCHENWDKMITEEKGKFCQSCSKTVVDFTKMNVNDIQDYIHNNRNQHICGHIKQSQLNAINLKIPLSVFNQTWNFHRLFLIALLLAMGTSLLSCSDEKGNIKKIETIEVVEKTIDSTIINKIKTMDTISKIKIVDRNKVKKPISPIPAVPLIMGDIVVVDGMMEITPHLNKQPYAYNQVDEKPKFLNTPVYLSKDEERKYFHKQITNLIDENFKVEQEKVDLKGRQRIYCQLEINENGKIENLKIRAPHAIYENETKRVFDLLPIFIPAKHNGKNVSVLFSLPIVFVIED